MTRFNVLAAQLLHQDPITYIPHQRSSIIFELRQSARTMAGTNDVFDDSAMSTRLQRPRPSSSRQSSGSSLPYLNDLNDVSGSDNDAEQGLERTKSGVTLKGKGMFSRADVDKCGRINVML